MLRFSEARFSMTGPCNTHGGGWSRNGDQVRLGGEDGMQLARGLRDTSEVPVIIVTGKQDEADRVMGLEIAADDYVTKPFSNREMLARIKAQLRRAEGRLGAGASAHGFRIDEASRRGRS